MEPRILPTLLFASLLVCVACRGREQVVHPPVQGATGDAVLQSVLIEDVPHVRQKPDFCGEAVAESALRARGEDIDQDEVFGLSGMDPARGMGATSREMKTALSALGFEVGKVWNKVEADSDADLDKQFGALHQDLMRGVPSIICTRYDDSPNTTEHFRLILGYDQETDEVIYHEPAQDNGSYLRMGRAEFKSLWPLKYDDKEWTVIRFRLDAATIKPPREQGAMHTAADFAQHVLKLRETLPTSYQIVVEPPFVVIGNGSKAQVMARAEGTVRWAVKRLKADYFERDPREILDVYLFEDAASYNAYVRTVEDPPDTPYGYYSSSDGALVMNISTGGGTLVHEIVHPFIEANFPDSPAWFNEGLGSLYEQSGTRGGHIIGHTNWRLSNLQEVIRRKILPSLKWLTHTSKDEFYDDEKADNYAQARYLLYYLQEKGLLHSYYRLFLANQDKDPTGYKSLLSTLGITEVEMPAFETEWKRWVLALHFR